MMPPEGGRARRPIGAAAGSGPAPQNPGRPGFAEPAGPAQQNPGYTRAWVPLGHLLN
jgi:hypothetical protein